MIPEEIRHELGKLGIMIQTEHPLHEPPMSYLEPLGMAKSNTVLDWWKTHPDGCADPLWFGRGHLSKAYAEARRLLRAIKDRTE